LLAANPSGLSFESLCVSTKLKPSTLSHHLKQMEKGKVIKRKTKGPFTWIFVDLDRLQSMPSTFVDHVRFSTRKTAKTDQISFGRTPKNTSL
jgi:hypothetical protein